MVLLELFWSFCKIGYTSFGGLSMIPLINSEMLEHGWMNLTEVADIVAIAEMTPGPLGLNCATFAGMRVAGIPGALFANLGMLAPTLTVCALAAVFFEKFKASPVLKHIMRGVRPVAVGMIWAVIFGLCRTNYMVGGSIQWVCALTGIGALVLLIKYKMSIPKVIGIAAVIGVLFVR